MKTRKPSRRWLAEQSCAENRFSMQLIDVALITRMIKDLMKLLQVEVNYDDEMVDCEVEVIKKELGAWFIEDYALYIGS